MKIINFHLLFKQINILFRPVTRWKTGIFSHLVESQWNQNEEPPLHNKIYVEIQPFFSNYFRVLVDFSSQILASVSS